MNFSKLFTPIVAICFLSILITVSGCDVGGAGSSEPKEVAVTMQLQKASQPAKLKTSTAPTTLSVDSLTEIKLLVKELELESAVDEDSLDFEAQNMVVDLPMDSSEFVLTSKTVPAGIYEEFQLEIGHDDEGQNVNDPDFSEGKYSVIIKGYYNGEAFTYRSEQDFEIELELNPPLEITENSSSFAVNINIDPSSWFVNPENGEPLDPSDPNNHEQIDHNIKQSFGAEHEEHEDDGHEEHSDDDSHDDNDSDD